MFDAVEYSRRRKAALAVMNAGITDATGIVKDGSTYMVPSFLRDSSSSAMDGRLEFTDADILDAVGHDPKISYLLGLADSANRVVAVEAARNLSALASGYAGRLASVTDETEKVALKHAADALDGRASAVLARTQ